MEKTIPSGIYVRSYSVLHRAVEEGVVLGWQRAHKHSDQPDAETVKDYIVQSVMDEIEAYFEFKQTP
jgi:hypothetical protein